VSVLQDRSRFALYVGYGLLALAYLALAWQQLRYGIEFDEGFNLTVVRNMASGVGYSTTGIVPWTWEVPFDPNASTGPALLLPASLVWFLTGGSLEATRIVPFVFFSALVVTLGLLFYRVAGRWAALIAASSPLLLSVAKEDISTVSLVPGRLVGEITATACIIVMAVLLSSRRPLLAGLAGGLAIQAKLHFALPVVVTLTTWWLLEKRFGRQLSGQTLLRLGVGMTLPTIAFETFRLASLGAGGYLPSVRNLGGWLLGQGASAGNETMLDSAGRRLGGLLAVMSLLGALLLLTALATLVFNALTAGFGTHSAASPNEHSTGIIPLIALLTGTSVLFAWWMFYPPEKLPRVGIPILLIVTPTVLVAAFVSLTRGLNSASSLSRFFGWVFAAVFVLLGLLLVITQMFTALNNDFGARMLAEQRAASAVIRDSDTPSLPMDWIWNLAQFQILADIPSQTNPDVDPPTVLVFDSIRARTDYGVDDARIFTQTCDQVLFESQAVVICAADF
jgi:hypothetical protein